MPRPKEGSRRKKSYPSTTFDVYNHTHAKESDSVRGLAGREIRNRTRGPGPAAVRTRLDTGPNLLPRDGPGPAASQPASRRKAGGPPATSSGAAPVAPGRRGGPRRTGAPGSAWHWQAALPPHGDAAVTPAPWRSRAESPGSGARDHVVTVVAVWPGPVCGPSPGPARRDRHGVLRADPTLTTSDRAVPGPGVSESDRPGARRE
jgi:hypothetical protein